MNAISKTILKLSSSGLNGVNRYIMFLIDIIFYKVFIKNIKLLKKLWMKI